MRRSSATHRGGEGPLAPLGRASLWAFAALAVASVLAILGFLAAFSLPIFSDGRLSRVLTWTWQPLQGEFGVLPMMTGTLLLATSAVALALPMGVGVCGFAHGVGPRSLGRLVRGIVQFMTGIPTVVYGFVSVFLLVPLVRATFGSTSGYCWLSAALTLAFLTLPTVVIVLDGHLRHLDSALRLGAAALGLNPAQQFAWVFLPASSRGLLAAALLAFGRAVGDTLVSLMVAGNAPLVPSSPLAPLRTLTAHIGLVLAADVHSTAYHSLFLSGVLLFGVTALVSLGVRWVAAAQEEGEAPR